MRGLTSGTKFFLLSGAFSSPMPSQIFLPVLRKALIRTAYSPATGPRAASIAYSPLVITAPALGPRLASSGTNEMSPASSGEPLIVTFPLTAPRLELPQPAAASTPTQTRATSHVCLMRECSRETTRLAPSESAEHFPAGGRAQRLPGLQGDVVGNKKYAPVAEEDLDAVGVPAPRRDDVTAVVVRRVRADARGLAGRHAKHVAQPVRVAGVGRVVPVELAVLRVGQVAAPVLAAAGAGDVDALSDQHRVAGAVGDVRDARLAVDHEDARPGDGRLRFPVAEHRPQAVVAQVVAQRPRADGRRRRIGLGRQVGVGRALEHLELGAVEQEVVRPAARGLARVVGAVQVVLFGVRQDERLPGGPVREREQLDVGRGEVALRVVVVVQGQAELLEVVLARHACGRLSDL